MKNIQRGFTLAEIILSVGIIGIVSAMGLMVSKYSTEKAYNLFYYSGYISLYNSLLEAEAQKEGQSNTDILAGVARYLDSNVKTLPSPINGNDKYIKTSNGIQFYFRSTGLDDNSYIYLTMEVPQPKTRTNNGKASVVLMYTKVDDISYLIPVDTMNDVKLQERRDLLPAYIDDGIVGRADANGQVRAIAYYNYKQAYCAMTSNKSIDSVISCTGVTGKPSAKEGVLKVRDPRKAR